MENTEIPQIPASEWSGLSTKKQSDRVRSCGGLMIVLWHGDPELIVLSAGGDFEVHPPGTGDKLARLERGRTDK
ncbi:MAG: hypothetical protein GY832_26150 [Chloroflexi bacterium]|nr:hypothetical protein [Chloroflexota bacterium]